MSMDSGGKRVFEFPKAAGAKYGFPYTSHSRLLRELIEHGFITCIENNAHRQKPNVYEFTLRWKDDI